MFLPSAQQFHSLQLVVNFHFKNKKNFTIITTVKMETIIKTKVDFKVSLELTENEARALEAIIGYGFKPFIEMFYNHLGKHYLQPFEKDAKNLFDQRQNINFQLYNIEKIKEAVKSINLNPGVEIEGDRIPNGDIKKI